MRWKFLALLVLALLPLAAAADIQLNDFYGPGEILSGKLALNLTGMPADANLAASVSDSSIGNISILDFLKNSDARYSCTSNCSYSFDASGPFITKKVSNDYVALVIPSGKKAVITSIDFNMSSDDKTYSCGSIPSELDWFDDGIIDWQYMEPSDSFCENLTANKYFDKSKAEPSYNIVTEPYCEKINLGISKRFKLGADIVQGIVPVKLSMSISDGIDQSECDFDNTSTGLQTCIVNFTATQKQDYYVCIYSDSDDSDTMIYGETSQPNCGNFGSNEFNCSESSADYAIYAQPALFKSFYDAGKLEFNTDVFGEMSGQSLEGAAQDYIDKNYGSDCSSECVIPIKVISNNSITFSDLSFKYSTSLGAKTDKSFYSASKTAPKVNASQQTLDIYDAGFKLPQNYGNFSLKLFLNNQIIASKTITIAQVPVISSFSPSLVSAATSTKFSVSAYSPKNNALVSYEWDFGDGTVQTTTDPYVMHSYDIGNSTLTVKVTDSEGLSNSRKYQITAQEPETIVNMSIERKNANLNSLRVDIGKIPEWQRGLIKQTLDPTAIESKLSEIELLSRQPNADFVSIKKSLDALSVPSRISSENIESAMHSQPDVSYIETLDNSEVTDASATNEKIRLWNSANIDITAFSTALSAFEDTTQTDLLTAFKIAVTSKTSSSDKTYLIIKSPVNGIIFKENYSDIEKQNVNGAFGFILDLSEEKDIEFAVPGKHSSDEFTIFASPTLDYFKVGAEAICGDRICDTAKGETFDTCPLDCKKPYGTAVTWIIIVIAIAAAGLFVIWRYYAALYDRKLRAKLFPQSDDFNKITFFIANEMNRFKEDKSIRDELEKAGWKNSQIDYAMKKVKEHTKNIQKKTIAAFVQRELAKNKSEQDIRKELASAGWSSSLVNYGFKSQPKKKK